MSQRYYDLDKYLHKQPKTFIFDHRRSMDPCHTPDHIHLSGQFAVFNGRAQSLTIAPSFVHSTTPIHSDITGIPVEDIQVAFSDDDDVPWEGKSNARLLWRGSSTGNHFSPFRWRR